MTDPATKQWPTICHLTTDAMAALVEVEQALLAADAETLSPLDFRALVWVRCTLATLYGIRADEAVGESALSDLRAMLESAWMEALPGD